MRITRADDDGKMITQARKRKRVDEGKGDINIEAVNTVKICV